MQWFSADLSGIVDVAGQPEADVVEAIVRIMLAVSAHRPMYQTHQVRVSPVSSGRDDTW